VPSLLCKLPVQLKLLLLKVAALLEVQAQAVHPTDTTDGKLSVMMTTSKNATTISTFRMLVQVHQEMPSQPRSSLPLENKSSQLKSSNPCTLSMLPTPPTLKATPKPTLLNQRTGTSLDPSPTKDMKSTNPATKDRTTSLELDKDRAHTPKLMMTGTLMSAIATPSTEEEPEKLMINSMEKNHAVRTTDKASLTQMTILTKELTLKSKRPSVTSSVKPSTDVSQPPSTDALTSNENTTPLSLAHELTLHLILLSHSISHYLIRLVASCNYYYKLLFLISILLHFAQKK
jgi:hypothetical protein